MKSVSNDVLNGEHVMRIISITEDITMDENNSLSHQNGGGGQIINSGQNQTNLNNKVNDDNNGNNSPNATQYTIPGILHYIQHEWTRFEQERSQWDVDRAELQVKSTFVNATICVLRSTKK